MSSFNTLNSRLAKYLKRSPDLRNLLRHGRYTTDFANYKPIIAATKNSTRMVLDVTILRLDSWNSKAEQCYRHACVAAVRRGVKVERVLVYDKSSLVGLQEMIRVLMFDGIAVFTVPESELQDDQLINMIIFDNLLSYETRLTVTNKPLKNVFSTNPVDVNTSLAFFRDIRRICQDGA